MERKINWRSGCHDEIELVYDKANENETLVKSFRYQSCGIYPQTKASRKTCFFVWSIRCCKMAKNVI